MDDGVYIPYTSGSVRLQSSVLDSCSTCSRGTCGSGLPLKRSQIAAALAMALQAEGHSVANTASASHWENEVAVVLAIALLHGCHAACDGTVIAPLCNLTVAVKPHPVALAAVAAPAEHHYIAINLSPIRVGTAAVDAAVIAAAVGGVEVVIVECLQRRWPSPWHKHWLAHKATIGCRIFIYLLAVHVHLPGSRDQSADNISQFRRANRDDASRHRHTCINLDNALERERRAALGACRHVHILVVIAPWTYSKLTIMH
jgi:hypothetical protein